MRLNETNGENVFVKDIVKKEKELCLKNARNGSCFISYYQKSKNNSTIIIKDFLV